MKLPVLDTIKKILVDRFAIKPELIQPVTHLEKDLKLDSMDAIDLLLALNETFNIRIPEQALTDIHSINDLVVIIKKLQPRA